MTSVLNQHVLVLNKGWVPVHVATVRRALSLLFSDQAVALDENYCTHNFASWADLSQAIAGGHRISTIATKILVPYVIVLTGYNSVPKRLVRLSRRNIYERDGGVCQYCGKRPARDEISIDHVLPRSRGGRSEWTNLVLACTNCNSAKADKLLSECGMTLLQKPVRPNWPVSGTVRVHRDGAGYWQKFVNDAYWNVTLEH